MTIRIFRALRWRRIALIAGGAVLLIPLVFIAFMCGFFSPLQSLDAQWKIAGLERQLHVGESRADIEKQFGHTIAQPERLDGYSVSSVDAVPGWEDHLGEYSYVAGSELCFVAYRGIVVYYDRHERVKRWKRFDSGDGC
jgi:hypothetical protein